MKERFNRIYVLYKNDIYGYMVYMAKDRQLAEELTQETYLPAERICGISAYRSRNDNLYRNCSGAKEKIGETFGRPDWG